MPSCFVNPFQGKKRIRSRKRGATSLPTASPAAKVSVEKNKTYLKDVILLPSPKVTYVPKGHAREDLFLNGFVISGYVLNSSDTEIVIKENLEKEFREIFNCMESVLKFEFVRAVEKKVVTLKTVGEKNGKTIYHVAGCRDRPIYIRAMEDVRYLLSSKELFPSGSDDDSEDGFDISIHQSKEALENKSVSNQKSFDCSMPSSSSIPVDDFAHYKLQVHHAAEIPSEHLEEETTKKEECPVCHKLFSKVLILGHVDLCIDRNCSPDPCPSSLEEELLLVRKTFIDQDHIDFIVRLRHCFSDTMKKMRLLFKDGLLRPISVEFVGNSAVDGGGPCRELFTNCFDSAKDFLLNGPEKNYTLQHDAHKIEKKEYLFFGKMVALSILHSGPGPHNLCKSLAQFILGITPELRIDDIADYDVQASLKSISVCSSQQELDQILTNFDARYEAGYNNPCIKLCDVKDLIEKVCKYYIITRQLEEVQQFCEGLNSYGILDILTKYPERSLEELIYDSKSVVTAKALKEMFKLDYSDDGPMKTKEEDIVFQWVNFLEEIELGTTPILKIHEIDGEIQNVTLTLELVLKFLTGCKFLPVGGLGKQGKIFFTHNCQQGTRVLISTCAITVTFPVNDRYSTDNFAMNLSDDILQSPGFGRV